MTGMLFSEQATISGTGETVLYDNPDLTRYPNKAYTSPVYPDVGAGYPVVSFLEIAIIGGSGVQVDVSWKESGGTKHLIKSATANWKGIGIDRVPPFPGVDIVADVSGTVGSVEILIDGSVER